MYRDSLPPPSQRATRILVVSADRERRRRVTRLLRCDGFDVDTRDEGAGVIDHVNAHPPDLVLLDVELPDAHGFEICTALRSRDDTRVIPIVLVSTDRVDELSVVQGLGVGADDYVTDPDRLAELKARVEVQLRNKRDRELLVWAYTQRAMHRREARIDGLTGLANRRAGDDALDDALDDEAPLVTMLLDIDHFKKVNDTYGHQAGDVVLKHVARTLMRLARQGDVVSRFGGEEFLVLLRNAHPDVASRVAERFRKGIEALELPPNAGVPQVTVSVGVATWDTPDGTRPDRHTLLDTADGALYEAKRGGRNRVVLRAMRRRNSDVTREIRIEAPTEDR